MRRLKKSRDNMKKDDKYFCSSKGEEIFQVETRYFKCQDSIELRCRLLVNGGCKNVLTSHFWARQLQEVVSAG